MRIDSTGRRLIAQTPAELEELERLAYLALLATIEAPEKRGANSYTCGIPWHILEQIRASLEGARLNWRAACRSLVRTRRIATLEREIATLEIRSGEDSRIDSRLERYRAELAKLTAGKS